MNQSIKTIEAHNAWRKRGGRLCVQTPDIWKAVDDCVKAAKRYEVLRTLNPRQFKELYKRNLRGENFDSMIDNIANARKL